MSNLTESPVYESGIYQLEITDPVAGGEDGVSNLQAKQLANRTAYLKQKTDELKTSVDNIEQVTGIDGSNGQDGSNGNDGNDGSNGQDGANGARGAGRYEIGTTSGAWSSSVAQTAIGQSPVNGDVVTIYKHADPKIQSTKMYNGSSWQAFALHIHGSVLIEGTVVANELSLPNHGVNIRENANNVTIQGIGILSTHFSIDRTGIDSVNEAGAIFEGTYSIGIVGSAANREGVVGISRFENGMLGNSQSDHFSGVVGQGGYGVKGEGVSYDFYAAGSGANYGPFTGAHDGIVPNNFTGIAGDLVTDDSLLHIHNISNAICKMSLSSTANNTTVRGVLVAIKNLPTDQSLAPVALTSYSDYAALQISHKKIIVNALGEGVLNCCGEGGDIVTGDYITTSNTIGKGMKQADQTCERPYTVAQARHNVTFNNASEVKQVAVIYLRG